ncbi:hypothetical protein F350042L8_09670 [Fusobacterium ulcerans]|uniref:sulfotransferase domain-containing protein n=2 Tax=Fusobacterium ulcerans TaxID=861 RepID=UPI0034C50A66
MLNVNIAGFYDTGASAAIDLLREFEKVEYVNENEFQFFNYGLLDLENVICNNFHPLAISEAIRRYNDLSKYYSKYGIYGYPLDSKKLFNGYFIERTEMFINSICIEEKRIYLESVFYQNNKIETFVRRLVRRIFLKLCRVINIITNEKLKKILEVVILEKIYSKNFYIIKDKEIFKKELEKYINDLFKFLNQKNKETEVFIYDQLLSMDGMVKNRNRIKNLKSIYVDRDPRDMFLSFRETNNKIAPLEVDKFIEWYKSMRNHILYGKNDEQILFIKFEDLIYDYEATVNKITKFLKIENFQHINAKKYFKKEISIRNTQKFKNNFKYKNEIERIEKELEEYCYKKYF